MPPTRRSTGSARAHQPLARGQSTLSFSNRVSKSGATHNDSKKDGKKAATAAAISSAAVKAEEEEVPRKVDVEVDVDADEQQQEDSDIETKIEGEEIPAQEKEKSEAERRAETITDAQILKYWNGIEAQRVAPRVHGGDLTTGEKVLRYFDVSSQYGPCIGIQRMKRWQRADKLGLEPPIEVLSVLLEEERKRRPAPSLERAHMDEILNSTVVESA